MVFNRHLNWWAKKPGLKPIPIDNDKLLKLIDNPKNPLNKPK